MKHLLSMTAATLLLASTASAQIGLPLVDTWRPLGDGIISGAAGYSSGDDVDFFGVRGNYGLTDSIDIFLDLGVTDVDGADSGIGVKLGAIYQLPLDLVCPLGIRVALYEADLDDAVVTGVNCALVTGMELQSIPGMTIGAGLGFTDNEFEIDVDPVNIQQENTDLFFSIGAAYNVSDRAAVWLEVTSVDETFIALGGSYAF